MKALVVKNKHKMCLVKAHAKMFMCLWKEVSVQVLRILSFFLYFNEPAQIATQAATVV